MRIALLAAALVACSGSSGTSNEPSAPTPEPSPAPSSTPAPSPSPAPTPAAAPFERFAMTGDETPCPSQAHGDCRSSVDLLADGTLHMDAWGEPGAAPLTAQVPAAAVADVSGSLVAPALLALLDQAKPCPEANTTETMLVRIAGTEHHNTTGYCNEAAIQAARGAMVRLTADHFPGHSLITPPF